MNAGVDKVNNSSLEGKFKENLLNVVILVLAVIIAFKIYQSKVIEINNLKNQKEMETNKNSVLAEISIVEKEIAFLTEKINNKSLASLLDKVSDFAKNSSVKISKITPQKESVMGAYTKYSYELSLSAGSYHNIGNFVSMLENSPDIYRFDNLVINGKTADGSDSVTATLTVYTILINK